MSDERGAQYAHGFSEDDYDRLKAEVLSIARRGPFDMNTVTFEITLAGITLNAGSIGAIVHDLEDLGDLQRIDGDPVRWRHADSTA